MRATVLFNPMKGYILRTSFTFSPRIPATTTAISNINPSPLYGRRRSYVSKPICYNLTAQPRACSAVNPNGVAGEHVRRYASSAIARDVSEMKKQLSDIPSTLTTETLLGLPLETMLRCRYVCKAWDGFFTDPEFVKRQLAASPIHFLERYVEEDRAIHFGRVVKDDSKLQAHTVDFNSRLLHLPEPTYWCVNSSNGLLCLVGNHGSISVCNPLLGESVSIPEPVNYKGGGRSEAIGFSAKDGLYKVLVAYQLQDNSYGFEIYTLGSREWRVVDSVEGCTPWHSIDMDFDTFLHGSLHWVSVCVSWDGTRVRSLWSFNFETEKFQRFELPDPRTSPCHDTCTAHYTEIDGEGEDDDDLHVQLGIMNGRLWVCFCDTKRPTEADIWVMKEYGVKDSWAQILAFRSYYSQIMILCPGGFIRYGYNGNNSGNVTHPRLLFSFSQKDIVIPDEKDPGKSHPIHVEKVLIADDSGDLICYNTKKWKERLVEFNTSTSHTYDFRYVTAYFPSFVSLQDVAKGEEVSRAEVSYNEGGGERATCQWINDE